jgi:ABC-2 type transport system permease protein
MLGLIQHFLLTLKLNLRSKQALVYGYLVPIFFLLAFGSVFRSGVPPLMKEMGQLLTISVLGGACFGMPTALVAERERGVWRRYRLLPTSIARLLTGTVAARFIIIASAALMQIVLARIIFGTPLPRHPLDLICAFTMVVFSFLGMGLVIAALAENVPAVQALGQSIFLPMIMIGGVGVPLVVLPGWAQKIAGFLPGRYAVEALQPTFGNSRDFQGTGFDFLALLVIGLAAWAAGLKLFRWDTGRHLRRFASAWVAAALVAWLAVGAAAWSMGRLKTETAGPPEPMESITPAQIDSISYEGLPADDDNVTPLAATLEGLRGDDKDRMDDLVSKLQDWPPGHVQSVAQAVRNLISVATVADVGQDPLEGRIALAVYDRLAADFDKAQLEQALTWLILNPQAGTLITTVPELGLDETISEDVVRDRDVLYAKKFLGRLTGKRPG